MSSPEETKQAADLIERLLTDPAFRAEFRRDPATACEKFGLTELADELRGGTGAKALYTLELRQSMSSLAGVIMAAAAEGIGVLELAGYARAGDKQVAGVVNEALSRHSIKAISQAQMQSVDHRGQGSHEQGEGHPKQEHGASHHEHEQHDHAHHDHSQHEHAQHEHEHGNGRRAPAPHEGHSVHADQASLGKTPAVAAPPESHHDAPPRHEDEPAPVHHHAPKPPVHQEEPHPAAHDHGPSLAEAGGPAVPPSDELAALLDNPNLELPSAARADLESGRVDPRLVSMLTALTKEHKIGLSVVISGHDQFTSGGSVSNHFVGRGLDIARVDGEIVRANSFKSRELAEALVDLPESIRPTEVGTPWSINAPGFFTDGGHQDHLHIAFDDPPPEGFAPPAPPAAPAVPAAAAPAAEPVAAAEVPATAAPEPAAAELQSGVFAAAKDGDATRSGNTVQFMRAVHDDVKAKIQQQPEPDVEVGKAASEASVGPTIDGYPGDEAPKEQIAAWMAARAQAAGLPPELPVMAALVESRLSNINFGDADSIGYFQMRTSIWDHGEYAGYGQDPEKQIKWFIDHAVHEKEKRFADGFTNFLSDESRWGDWVADVERPAEQYRGRYQERLAEARALLAKSRG